jgi:hypothetical protein
LERTLQRHVAGDGIEEALPRNTMAKVQNLLRERFADVYSARIDWIEPASYPLPGGPFQRLRNPWL